MVSLLKEFLRAKREVEERKKLERTENKNRRTMVPKANLIAFRLILFVLFMVAIVRPGYAPPKGPKLPEGFCEHGDVTETTGECMCHWQHKDGCTGSKCEYQMGLSFYHYSCKDCKCVKEP